MNLPREQSIVQNLSTMNGRQLQDTVNLLVNKFPELADNVEFLIGVALRESKDLSRRERVLLDPLAASARSDNRGEQDAS